MNIQTQTEIIIDNPETLTIEIIEKATGIDCSNLFSKQIFSPIEYWILPDGVIEPDTWLKEGLNRLMNFENFYKLVINQIVITILTTEEGIFNDSNVLKFSMGEKREYTGNIVATKKSLSRVTLKSNIDYEIITESKTLVLKAAENFTKADEIELLSQMSIIYGIRKGRVFGALATIDKWRFYIIKENGTVFKTRDFNFKHGELSRILFIFNYILKTE